MRNLFTHHRYSRPGESDKSRRANADLTSTGCASVLAMIFGYLSECFPSITITSSLCPTPLLPPLLPLLPSSSPPYPSPLPPYSTFPQDAELISCYLSECCLGRSLVVHAIYLNVDDFDCGGVAPAKFASVEDTAHALRDIAHSTGPDTGGG